MSVSLEDIFQRIRENKAGKELNLSRIGLAGITMEGEKVDFFDNFFDVLSKNTKIQKLKLAGCQFCPEEVKKLLKVLSERKVPIVELDLSNNHLKEGMKDLISFIENNPNLKSLKFDNCSEYFNGDYKGLSIDDLKKLKENIRNSNITDLSFKENIFEVAFDLKTQQEVNQKQEYLKEIEDLVKRNSTKELSGGRLPSGIVNEINQFAGLAPKKPIRFTEGMHETEQDSKNQKNETRGKTESKEHKDKPK